MLFQRLFLFVLICLVVTACGNDDSLTDDNRPTSAGNTSHGVVESQPAMESDPENTMKVKARILPERAGVTDCLHVVIQGEPGVSGIKWLVNDNPASGIVRGDFCGPYKRGDVVTVVVGTEDQGTTASIEITNSLPRVIDISSTPDEIFAGTDVSVEPIAEDADGDDVSFSYQWLINGEENPVYTEATLPGTAFTKGNSLQVLITPNDFYEDGPVYESYATLVPNAPPTIVSKPPESLTSLDYRYQLEVKDPDDSLFTYRLDKAPKGMEIDPASGLIRWSLEGVEPGAYTITIIVTDPEGAEGAQEFNLTLGAPE